jgi:hypothetical protein
MSTGLVAIAVLDLHRIAERVRCCRQDDHQLTAVTKDW